MAINHCISRISISNNNCYTAIVQVNFVLAGIPN